MKMRTWSCMMHAEQIWMHCGHRPVIWLVAINSHFNSNVYERGWIVCRQTGVVEDLLLSFRPNKACCSALILLPTVWPFTEFSPSSGLLAQNLLRVSGELPPSSISKYLHKFTIHYTRLYLLYIGQQTLLSWTTRTAKKVGYKYITDRRGPHVCETACNYDLWSLELNVNLFFFPSGYTMDLHEVRNPYGSVILRFRSG